MERLDQLLDLLDKIAAGQHLSYGDLESLSWNSDNRLIHSAADDSWRRLRHFAYDEDVRAKDALYDEAMRNEMKWRAEEIRELMAGRNPYGRKP